LEQFAQDHEVCVFLQGGGVDSIEPLWPVLPPALRYRLPDFGLELAFGPTDFVQVNAAMNNSMVSRALELLAPTAEECVLDLFCGIGNFSLALARRAGMVLGIEADDALVVAARENARENGVANIEFRQADLLAGHGEVPWADFRVDKLLLDPPRTGAMEVIRRLVAPLPTRIVYVSCYPSTLARDAAHLTSALGYDFKAAGVMDMFPHTSHVESIALFSREDNAA